MISKQQLSNSVKENSSHLREIQASLKKVQNNQSDIETALPRLVILPAELPSQVEEFVRSNRQLGFATVEDFVGDAVRFRLVWLKSDNKCIEVPRQQFERLEEALNSVGSPFGSAEQFVNSQIEQFLEKYEVFKNTKENSSDEC